jgi:hypothetical protein
VTQGASFTRAATGEASTAIHPGHLGRGVDGVAEGGVVRSEVPAGDGPIALHLKRQVV